MDPALYDTDYYVRACLGADEWRTSGGTEFAGLYPGALRLAGMQPGWRVLDIGCGRGDLVCVAAREGAAEAVGVDYSKSAIALAEETLERAGASPKARVCLADARRIPVASGHFDLVTLLDVVEHLSDTELDHSLAEARRALKPGGTIFIHTMPNANIYDITYRIQRLIRPGRRRRWPEDPRNDFERAMHVNEQTTRKLRRVLRNAGFEDVRVKLGSWIYADFVPDERARRLYSMLASLPALRQLGVADMFGWATKPTRT